MNTKGIQKIIPLRDSVGMCHYSINGNVTEGMCDIISDQSTEEMCIRDSIVDLHTQHYKEDFDLDQELISKLAVSDRSEDKQLLWMSRPCGTYTLREREVYLDGKMCIRDRGYIAWIEDQAVLPLQ